jgi:hypothetical protein
MRAIAILTATLALAGCTTTGTVAPPDRPRLDAPSAMSMQDCLLPVALPPGEMTQRDIERYWGTDRKHQVECAKRHAILRDYIIDRDGGLTRKTK